jgi:hypothetical protein
MVKERVTMDDLQKFAVGDMKTFTLPNYERARSAASNAYQAKNKRNTYGWQFKTVIGDAVAGTMERSITITRTA